MSEAEKLYRSSGNGCICHIVAPCAFCTSMTEEEADIFANRGVHGLLELWFCPQENEN